MTKENFEKAHVALTRIEKLKAIKSKLEREFSEFTYDVDYKEIGNAIYKVIEARINQEQKDFDSL